MMKWHEKLRDWWGAEEPPREEDEYIDIVPETAEGKPPEGFSLTKHRFLTRLRKGSRRDQQIEALQAGYSELLELIRSIRGHLDNQAQGQDRLLDLLQHLPDAVDGLKGVGKTSEQQAEVLELLHKQLESNVDHDDKLVDCMVRFNDTLGVMDETSRNSATTMERLAERTRDSEDLLRGMLERSERRLVLMITGLAVITVLVVGAGIYYALTSVSQGEGPSARNAPVLTSIPAEPPSLAPAPEESVPGLEVSMAVNEETALPAEDAAIVETEADTLLGDEPMTEPEEEQAETRRFLFFGRSK